MMINYLIISTDKKYPFAVHTINQTCLAIFAKYYVTKSLQIQLRNTDFDRCVLLGKIYASNFPSRFQKGSIKSSIKYPFTAHTKTISILKVAFFNPHALPSPELK